MGISYLLVIFVILCFVTFAVLSLSSAQKDQKNARKLADRQTAYCKANSEAAGILKEIQKAVKEEAVKEELTKIDGVDVTEDGENLQVDYAVEMTESQRLEAAVSIDLMSRKSRVVKWKESAASEWKETTTLPVLGSDS